MTLAALKTNLNNVLPLLNANLSAAYTEYMDGKIARGAYEYVRERHAVVLTVLDSDDLEASVAYHGCALLAIDLRCGVKDMAEPAKTQSSENVEAWWQCYRDAGYTSVHKFFNSPMLPA